MSDNSTTNYLISPQFPDDWSIATGTGTIGIALEVKGEARFKQAVFFEGQAFGEFHLNDNSSISNVALSSSSIFNSVLEMSFKSEFKNKEQDKILEALCKDYFYNHFYEWINL